MKCENCKRRRKLDKEGWCYECTEEQYLNFEAWEYRYFEHPANPENKKK